MQQIIMYFIIRKQTYFFISLLLSRFKHAHRDFVCFPLCTEFLSKYVQTELYKNERQVRSLFWKLIERTLHCWNNIRIYIKFSTTELLLEAPWFWIFCSIYFPWIFHYKKSPSRQKCRQTCRQDKKPIALGRSKRNGKSL